MGGNAFASIDPSMRFPRMDAASYQALRDQVTLTLRSMFKIVSVPPEAPQKADYGDLDIIVSAPLPPYENSVTAEDIRERIGATLAIGTSRMMNFAIPVQLQTPSADQGAQEWRQIDIEIIPEDRVSMALFMKGYGDLGMIIGMLVQSMGSDNEVRLALSLKGLVGRTPYGRMALTSDPQKMALYLGLEWSLWEAGFDSEDTVFHWVASSTYFKPKWFAYLLSKREATEQVARKENAGQPLNEELPRNPKKRPMLERFLEYCHTISSQQSGDDNPLQERSSPSTCDATTAEQKFNLEKTLAFFSANLEYQKLRDAYNDPIAAKAKFNVTLVKEWVGLPQEVNIPRISKVMKIVKAELGDVKGILECDPTQLRNRVQSLWAEDQTV